MGVRHPTPLELGEALREYFADPFAKWGEQLGGRTSVQISEMTGDGKVLPSHTVIFTGDGMDAALRAAHLNEAGEPRHGFTPQPPPICYCCGRSK